MNVLAIGAHPDDIEIGAGGTMARHVANGDNVHFLVMTYGERSSPKISVRKREAKKSKNIVGASSLNFANIPDCEVTDGVDTILKIEEIIKKIQPQRVYTHCTKDSHQDHRYTAYATISAARRVPEVLSYESPLTYPTFNPQIFVDITSHIETKKKAIMSYKSQVGKRYTSTDAIEGLAKFRGFQAGVLYAEAFEVITFVLR